MFGTIAQAAALGTGFGGIGTVDVFDPDACRLRLVFDKALKLCPRPAVQAGAHTLSRFDPLADFGQSFKGAHRSLVPYRFSGNCFADFVVDMGNVPPLSAGDFLQKLLGAFGSIALKAAAKVQKAIALMTEFPASEQRSAAGGGGKIVFSHIYAQNAVHVCLRGVGKVKNQVEKIAFALVDKLGFFRNTQSKILPLEGASAETHTDTPIKGREGKRFSAKAVGALVEVNGGTHAELDSRPLFFAKLWPVDQERFVRLGNLMYDITGHLSAKCWCSLSELVIGGMVELNSVGDFPFDSPRNGKVAGVGVRRCQPCKLFRLFRGCFQLQAHRAFHHGLASFVDVSRTFDIAPDCFSAFITRCSNIGGWRPRMPVPKAFF